MYTVQVFEVDVHACVCLCTCCVIVVEQYIYTELEKAPFCTLCGSSHFFLVYLCGWRRLLLECGERGEREFVVVEIHVCTQLLLHTCKS